MSPLKEGQLVFFKNPRNLVGTVLRQRSGEVYLVKIEEQELYYRLDDVEAIPAPSKELERYSPEWTEELQRFLNAGQRFIANNMDKDALAELSDAGTKIGWVKPIEKK